MRPFPPPPDSQATGDIPPTVGDINDLIRLADDYFERQQYAQAAAAYAQAVSLAPQQVEIYNNLGISLHYAGRSQEAIGKLKQGVAIDPHHQRIWLTLGFVQARAGNTPEARAALERAIAMDPRSEIGLEAKRLADALEQPVP
jgi:Tfp pilus assembly protein PilF